MKIIQRLLISFIVLGLVVYFYASQNRSVPVKPAIEQKRPNLAAIFYGNCNCQQVVDHFGNVSRSAFDASGNRIGTQVGHVGGPSGIVVEMTYLVPDADNPLGQAFDGDGNPMPLRTGPATPGSSPTGTARQLGQELQKLNANPSAGGAVRIDRDRGTPRDATPPPPPGIRVGTTAVRLG